MLKKTLAGLNRWFYFRQPCLLSPKSGLAHCEVFDWQAIDNDPFFSVKPLKGPMPQGWYLLEVKVRSSSPTLDGRLYLNSGDGYSEDRTFKLPLKSGRLFKKVVYFDHRVTSLRFDPCTTPATFTVEHFRFCKLTAGKARSLMIDKVKRWHPGYKLEAGSLKLEALKEAYSDCFYQTPLSTTYQQWIEYYEKPLFGDLALLRDEVGRFSYTPLVSIVIPVFNVDEIYLRKAIESVQNQIYPNWQLCIADDCSTEPHVKKVLDEFVKSDSRIKVEFIQKNSHISEASNTALTLASGEYIALLDHDDALAPHALFCVVKALNINPELSFIYSDEDFIDEDDHRLRPHFKSQWNPELLKAHNYITHLAVIRKTVIQKIGGFRKGFEGAQDYDLFLRLASLIPSDQIHHIPHVLYHWRAIEGSTAADSNSKTYATKAGIKALQEHLNSDSAIKVSHDTIANFYRVDYPLPEQPPLVSLIIPTRDALDVLKPCVDSILEKTDYPNYEIIIIDNQSDDPDTLTWFSEVSKNEKVRVIQYDAPFNYSLINNFAAMRAKGEVIGLINNDIKVINSNWLCEMVSLAIQQENGCIGAKLYYPDGDIQHAGVILGLGGYAAHSHRGLPGDHPGYFNRASIRQNLSAVTGACLLVRKAIFEEVDGLDKNFTVAYNDVDFCLKVQAAGYRNIFTPYAELYHHESKTRGYDDTPDKQARFQEEKELLAARWQELLDNDPYYSPNLTRSQEDFSLIL